MPKTNSPPPTSIDPVFIHRLLPLVSRTFALSIRALGEPLATRVAHAYLVCRLLDTIEDDERLPLATKRGLLQRLAADLPRGKYAPPAGLVPLAPKLEAKDAEKELVARAADVLGWIGAHPAPVASAIGRWAGEMAEGMAKWAAPPRTAKSAARCPVRTVNDLDEYCYYVAGTVGHMLTELFCDAAGRVSPKRRAILEETQEAFGAALQLVNILKDAPGDWLEGRCFLPREVLATYGTTPAKLFAGKTPDAARLVYAELVAHADRCLADAACYVRALPRRLYRTRLFCILPIALARRSLDLVRDDVDQLIAQPGSVKVTRKTVKRMVLVARLAAASNWVFGRMVR